jgi:Alpha-tubulin suppressor and related RCC1 domain-containing proteins
LGTVLNRACSVFVKLTVLSMLVITVGATECSSGTPDVAVTAAPLPLIRAGLLHSCVVRNDGTVGCWGNNQYGQAVAPSGQFMDLATGSYHTCGVGVDGRVSCWGSNDAGQATAPGGKFVRVSAGAASDVRVERHRDLLGHLAPAAGG